ncbi:MAG TPA: hypothetical protein VI168_10840 [Croceibacterium sp.]
MSAIDVVDGGMLLLLLQSALVCAGNVRLHRAPGTWGIAQGTATILIGLMMQLVASVRGHAAGRPAGTDGLYLGLLAFVGFALLFALAIRHRTSPAIHRRMILFAMLPVIPPGVTASGPMRSGSTIRFRRSGST